MKEIIENVKLVENAPLEEPARQYYFMEKAKDYVEQRAEKLASADILCHNIRLSDERPRFRKTLGILEKIGYVERTEERQTLSFSTPVQYGKCQHTCYGRLGQLSGNKEKEKSTYDDRTVRLYDAGTGSCRKVKKELPLCGSYLRNT